MPRPGTYFYVYFLHGSKLWESHPFTLSSWNTLGSDYTPKNKSLSFVIQPQDSFTARLSRYLARKHTSEEGSNVSAGSVSVLVEGPYGKPYALQLYDSARIIVGGSGVTAANAHLCDLREQLEKGRMRIGRVHVVWVVRHQAQFQDLLDIEIGSWLDDAGLSRELEVVVEVYITHHKDHPTGFKKHVEWEKTGNASDDSSPKSMSPEGNRGSPIHEVQRQPTTPGANSPTERRSQSARPTRPWCDRPSRIASTTGRRSARSFSRTRESMAPEGSVWPSCAVAHPPRQMTPVPLWSQPSTPVRMESTSSLNPSPGSIEAATFT